MKNIQSIFHSGTSTFETVIMRISTMITPLG